MNKIAVVIANYNYGHYLLDAIASCLGQTRKPDLVIIVDDNSIDDSKKKILTFLDNPTHTKENNIDIYSKTIDGVSFIFIPLRKTSGPSFARNVAIDLTKGQIDLYQILDADDIMRKDKLEKLEQKMMESPEIGVVYADYDILNIETGNLIREFKEPFSRRKLMQECIVHSGSMIKKDALLFAADQFGYYNVNMRTCEDYMLWIKISRRYVISHIPSSLTLVRVHNNNATATVKNEIWQQNWARVRQEIEKNG